MSFYVYLEQVIFCSHCIEIGTQNISPHKEDKHLSFSTFQVKDFTTTD
uniref:Uncharacterized protein n=1 Tax=Rhizophora mucronata TaxID=61149 RepID=A0A2P2NJW0_RHIMU